MSAWIFTSAVLSVIGSIVEYKFRQNYGQIFYDYSGNSHHGVNGASSLDTIGDTKATDRGAYFTTGYYITLPSNDAPASAFTFGPTFTITFWMYNGDSNLTLFTRVSNDPNYFFYLKRNSDRNAVVVQCNVGGSTSGELTGASMSFTRQEWVLMTIQMTTTHMVLYQNGIASTSSALPGGGYSESGTYTTRIGDLTATVSRMFIWYFIIESGIVDPSTYVTTTASTNCLTGIDTCVCCGEVGITKFIDPELGTGYMSSQISANYDSASTACAPSSKGCAITISLSCTCASLSCVFSRAGNTCQCINLSNGALTTATCTCVTGYADCTGKCCERSCSNCANTIPAVCTACKATYAEPDTTGCKCRTGYYGTAPLLLANACLACYQECYSCVQSSKCTACKASLAAIHATQGCYCPVGTYSTGSPLITAGACVACYQECASCSQSSKCITCIALLATADATQGCNCPAGTYSTGSPLITSGACVACYQECSTCSQDLICISCKALLALADATQGCYCPSGTYSTGSPLITSAACVACYQECSSCSQDHICISCKASLAVVHATQGCYCPTGTYSTGSPLITAGACVACYQECSACSQALMCISCKASLAAIHATQGCYCPDGTYSTGSPLITAGACVACYQECLTCSQDLICLTCKASLALVHATQGCYCPSGTYAIAASLINSGDCVACYQECSSCTESLKCTACVASLAAIDTTQGCYCPIGTYSTGSPLIAIGACVACYSECSSCSQALKCSACKTSLAVIHATQGCYCPIGTYSTGSPLITLGACVVCYQECLSCSQALTCLTCIALLATAHATQGCYCPVGTYSTGSPLITAGACVVCYQECSSCTQAQTCTSCKALLALVHATQGCYCPSGTYSTTSPLVTSGACVACYQECLTCVEALRCTACQASLALIHATQGCYCPTGTYSTGSPLITAGACAACYQECSACSQALTCISCKASLAAIHSTQGCYCPAGTYSTGSPLITAGACVACYQECLTCTQDLICITCKASLALTHATQGCYCPTGTYSTGSPLITAAACVVCYQECSDCTQDLICTGCKSSLALIHATQGCYCPTGTYSTGSPLITLGACVVCYQECSSCSQALACLTCIALLATADPIKGCYCPAGTYSTGSPLITAGACVACYQECLTCTQDLICIACKASLAVVHATQGCYCPSGTYSTGSPLISAEACVACYQECLTCIEALRCTACQASLALIHATQGCYCPTGTYSTGSPLITAGACAACYQECSACSQAMTCVSCKASLAAIHATQGCYCPAGTYSTGSPLITAGACVACYQECLTCTQDLICIACKASLAVVHATQGCYCPTGTYSTSLPLITSAACAVCYQECLTCVEALRCTACQASLALIHATQGCYCPTGTYSTGSPLITAGACAACYQECSACTVANLCTQCIAQHADVDPIQGCKCQSGYWGVAPLTNINSCTTCYSECKTCVDGNSCTTCVSANSTPNSPLQGCSCNSGYKSSGPLIKADSCQGCSIECATCNTPNVCITCKDPNQVPDQITGCNCKSGYYKDLNNNCQKCNIDCLTCNSAASCSTCASNNSYPGQDYCQCNPGYYNITKSPTTCALCPNDCITCYNSTLCTQCSILNAVATNIGTCICPNNSWILDNKCQCNKGLYMYEDLSYRECRSCDKSCISCSDAFSCDTCDINMQLDPITKLCVTQCNSGQVLIHGTCRSCPSLCNTCDTSLFCTQCVDNAINPIDTCSCAPGYTDSDNQCTPLFFWANLTVSSENHLMLEFSRKPESILKLKDFSLIISTNQSFTVSFIVKSQSVYHFYLSFTENIQQGTPVTIQLLKNPVFSIDLYHLQNYTFQCSLYKYSAITEALKATISKTKAASQSAVVTSLAIAVISNPAATWILINTIQVITYMPINANPLTPSVTAFFMALGGFNVMPNAMSYAFNQEISSAPYSNAQKLGINTSVFWVNFGPTATTLLFLIAIWPGVFLLSKIKLGKIAIRFSRVLSNYRYGVFLRFWIQAYLDVGFFSLIQIKATVNSPATGFFNVASATIGIVNCIQICVILTPSALFICSYVSKDRILNSGDTVYHKRFGSFFGEFKNNKGFLSTQYYTLYFIRRLVYLIAQMYLNNIPYLQASLNIFFTLLVLCYLFYYRPFVETHILISTLSSELCVLIVFSISTMFLQKVSDDILPYLENSIIFTVIGCMSIQLFITIYSFGISLKYMWMDIERYRAKLVLKNLTSIS